MTSLWPLLTSDDLTVTSIDLKWPPCDLYWPQMTSMQPLLTSDDHTVTSTDLRWPLCNLYWPQMTSMWPLLTSGDLCETSSDLWWSQGTVEDSWKESHPFFVVVLDQSFPNKIYIYMYMYLCTYFSRLRLLSFHILFSSWMLWMVHNISHSFTYV